MTDVDFVSRDRRSELQSVFGEGKGFDGYCARWEFRTGESYLFDNFLQDGSLLDIGCGTGRTSFLLAPRFTRVDAFDIVPEMIAFAHERRRQIGSSARFFVADASQLPVADAAYDNVLFSYNGIEGLPTAKLRQRVLEEAFRVLCPGGRFVFSTKSCFNLQYFKSFHIKRACRRIGLPLFPECAQLGPGQILARDGNAYVVYHASNPFRVKRALRRTGFRMLYFNSEVRLGAGRLKPSLRAHFDRWDHFYACEKP